MDHPALGLVIGDDDHVSQLSKLTPTTLSVNQLPADHVLYAARNSFAYVYVMNWLCSYKNLLKLSAEYFDVELFEMELLDMVSPPPVDESVLFINKLKTHLVSFVSHGKEAFEEFYKNWFGDDSALGSLESDVLFDNLSISDKVDILYVVLNYISSLGSFRTFIEKNDVILQPTVLDSSNIKNKTEEYILVFNETKLYKRTVTFPQLVVPKKRKDSPEDPDVFFKGKFDVTVVEFEVVAWDLYEMNDLITKLTKKSPLAYLKDPYFQQNLLEVEIKKRKIIQNKRKEYQLINLLATRKKSSRLEQKERQRRAEIQQKDTHEQQEIEDTLSGTRIRKPIQMNSARLSREDRLKLRKLNNDLRHAQTPDSSVLATPANASPAISISPEPNPDVTSSIEATASVTPSIDQIEAPVGGTEETQPRFPPPEEQPQRLAMTPQTEHLIPASQFNSSESSSRPLLTPQPSYASRPMAHPVPRASSQAPASQSPPQGSPPFQQSPPTAHQYAPPHVLPHSHQLPVQPAQFVPGYPQQFVQQPQYAAPPMGQFVVNQPPVYIPQTPGQIAPGQIPNTQIVPPQFPPCQLPPNLVPNYYRSDPPSKADGPTGQ